MAGRLEGKICVVTGATRGIGRGCAVALAEEGATIYITGRSNGDGELTLKGSIAAIEKAGGIGIGTQVDHANDAEIEAFFKKVAAEAGKIDILVNNVYKIPSPPAWGAASGITQSKFGMIKLGSDSEHTTLRAGMQPHYFLPQGPARSW